MSEVNYLINFSLSYYDHFSFLQLRLISFLFLDLSIINISNKSMNNGSYTFPHKNQFSPLLNTKKFKMSPIQSPDSQFSTKKDKLKIKDRKQVYLTPSRTAKRRLIEDFNTQW